MLEKLLRAYFIARPLKRRLFPKWDIGFVLQALYKHPFKPKGLVDVFEIKNFIIISRSFR